MVDFVAFARWWRLCTEQHNGNPPSFATAAKALGIKVQVAKDLFTSATARGHKLVPYKPSAAAEQLSLYWRRRAGLATHIYQAAAHFKTNPAQIRAWIRELAEDGEVLTLYEHDLTPRMEEIAAWCNEYTTQNGCPPKYRDIAEHFDEPVGTIGRWLTLMRRASIVVLRPPYGGRPAKDTAQLHKDFIEYWRAATVGNHGPAFADAAEDLGMTPIAVQHQVIRLNSAGQKLALPLGGFNAA